PDATTNLDRQRGFLSRLRELGVRNCLKEPGGAYSYEAGFAAATRLIRRKPRPNAIFFASDVMAFGGMDALRAAGLRVPDDISVVGFDDVPMADWPCHDLTSVRQPVDEMADAAVEMLGLDPARKVAAPTTRLIMGKLVPRGSTMPRKRAVTDDKP